MKKIFLLAAAFLFFAKPVMAATPTVSGFTPVSTTVGQYKKFEANLTISKTYPAGSFLPYYFYDSTDTPISDPGRVSPYGVDGISIDAHFTAPSGRQIVVPAFYYQDFTRTSSTDGDGTVYENITSTNNYSWKIRFAPEEIGQYSYYLTIQDKEGTTRYPAIGNLSFTSTTSTSKGFVRVSAIDPRFMTYQNGDSFIPVASGHPTWRCCTARSYDYESTFDKFGANGINLVRIWDQNDGYALVVEGQESRPANDTVAAALPKGTQMNQKNNYEEDKIIESAEKNGVAIQLCAHGDAYWIWDGSIYNEGWNTTPQSFSSKRHVDYWKRNFRYRVARWGYSTSVLAWEAWNEHGHVLVGSDTYNFYQTYGQYQKQTDPYNHLRTTSQGSQAYSPGLWSSSAMDLANYHDYMMGGEVEPRYPDELFKDEVNFVSKFAWCLGNKGQYCSGLGLGDGSSWSGEYKPWVWGELDVGTNIWDEPNPATKTGPNRVKMLHNIAWAGLFSPIGTTGIDWYWNYEGGTTTTDKYTQYKHLSNFFNGVDYDGAKFTFLTTANEKPSGYSGETLTSSNSQIRAYGMRRQDKKSAYLWVQNKSNVWSNSSTPSTANSNITIGSVNYPFLAESYKVEIYNTWTGVTSSSTTITPTSGSITVAVNNLATDVAIKITSTATTTPHTSIVDLRNLLSVFTDIFNYNNLITSFGK